MNQTTKSLFAVKPAVVALLLALFVAATHADAADVNSTKADAEDANSNSANASEKNIRSSVRTRHHGVIKGADTRKGDSGTNAPRTEAPTGDGTKYLLFTSPPWDGSSNLIIPDVHLSRDGGKVGGVGTFNPFNCGRGGIRADITGIWTGNKVHLNWSDPYDQLMLDGTCDPSNGIIRGRFDRGNFVLIPTSEIASSDEVAFEDTAGHHELPGSEIRRIEADMQLVSSYRLAPKGKEENREEDDRVMKERAKALLTSVETSIDANFAQLQQPSSARQLVGVLTRIGEMHANDNDPEGTDKWFGKAVQVLKSNTQLPGADLALAEILDYWSDQETTTRDQKLKLKLEAITYWDRMPSLLVQAYHRQQLIVWCRGWEMDAEIKRQTAEFDKLLGLTAR